MDDKVKQKVCPRCGASFNCYSEAKKPCWCNDFTISPENIKLLAKNYNGCVCPDCLLLYGEKVK